MHPAAGPDATPHPTLRQAAAVYLRIGLLSFGGPAGQIALMQEEITERRGWVTPQAFGEGLSVAMVLPGPEAQQLATWLGWRLHGMAGGLCAGLAFVLPGAVLMIALAWTVAIWGSVPLVAALFYGIQPAVLAIVLRATTVLAGRALLRRSDWALAGGALAGLWLFEMPFPLIIALAAGIGILRGGAAAAIPRRGTAARGLRTSPVSYTPLTLPTIFRVSLAADALAR